MTGSSMMRRGWGLALAVVACTAAGVACYGPTEVRLEISTDVTCRAVRDAGAPTSDSLHTLVRLGGALDAPIVADTTDCTDLATADGFRSIGSIVLVPSGDRTARVTVQVSATADGSNPDACGRPPTPAAPQDQCIVARRTFAFIKHTSRSLPIRLYAACKGHVCDTTETCNRFGTCESAVVDDMGCTASDPGCQAMSPAAMPDASDDAADATPALDAADAKPARVACTGAAGTNVLATGMPTDLIAANKKALFFVGLGPTFSTAEVLWIDTQDPGSSPLPLFSFPVVIGTATAIAADEAAVWVASGNQVYRHDLADGTQKTYEVTATTRSLATAMVKPAVAGGLPAAATAFVVTADVPAVGGGGLAPGSVFQLDPGTSSPTPFLVNHPGTQIAVSSLPSAAVYVFDSSQYGGPSLTRTPLGSDVPQNITPVGEPFTGMATDLASNLFFAADKALHRVDATGTATSSLYDIPVSGLVAVDSSFVYFAQKRAFDSAIFRGGKGGGDGPLLPADRLATGYTDVQGLAIDDACIYFWSTTATDSGTLNVYPKGRTVMGPAATVHTP